MLTNNEGNFYSFINEQIQIKGGKPASTENNDKLSLIEQRLLKMVDSLKITKYNQNNEDNI